MTVFFFYTLFVAIAIQSVVANNPKTVEQTDVFGIDVTPKLQAKQKFDASQVEGSFTPGLLSLLELEETDTIGSICVLLSLTIGRASPPPLPPASPSLRSQGCFRSAATILQPICGPEGSWHWHWQVSRSLFRRITRVIVIVALLVLRLPCASLLTIIVIVWRTIFRLLRKQTARLGKLRQRPRRCS